MRIALLAFGCFVLVVLGLLEIGLAFPVPWWVYLGVAPLVAAGLIRRMPVRDQVPGLLGLVAVWAVIAALYFIPWTTRKPFLRDLARVKAGMSEAEVRQVMRGYLEGTGWPASPFASSNEMTTLTLTGTGSQYPAGSESGELVIPNSLVFRHSTDGAFNSDWGIVSLSNGRVVRVEFSAD